MQWFPLILFAIGAVAWLSLRLILVGDGRRESTQLLNARQKYLSLISFALFVLSLLIVPWRVDAQLFEFPIFSHISYGWVWRPPSGPINQSLVGIVTARGGILLDWLLAEWLVLLLIYCCFLLAFRESSSNALKDDARQV